MGTAADKLRVLIPTTNGPVEVLLLTEEDSAIGRCVACIGGTTETADIAAAYHAFVVRPTGVIEGLFGHPCYRLDVSGRIDAGSSWQLGVLAAHALHAAGRLAGEKDAHSGVVWATGSVRPVDLTVGAVGHIPEKLAGSVEALKREAASGHRVLLALPEQNAPELSAEQKADLAGHGIEVLAPAHAQALFDALALKLPTGSPRMTAKSIAPRGSVRPSARRRMPLILAAVAAALLCVAAIGAYLLEWAPTTFEARNPKLAATKAPTEPEPPKAPTAPHDSPGAEADRLVPEQVPYISDRDQARIRSAYLPGRDYKALALGSTYLAYVTGEADQSAADAAAMAACQKISDAKNEGNVCDLWASGNIVVASSPPMPPQPWLVRDPSIDRPFVAADVPLVDAQAKKDLEPYISYTRSKALALAPTAKTYSMTNVSNPQELERRTLERCGYTYGVSCMIIAIDDEFVVPIPKLAKVVGFFRLEALAGLAPGVRESVAQQLEHAQSGWNAIAIGTSGQVGLELGASSEQAAIDGAMTACSKQDNDCRIAVIGPFMVEREAPTRAPTEPEPPKAPTAPHDSPGAEADRLVPEQVPYISDRDQARIRSAYVPGRDYKALALGSTYMAYVTGQADQGAADVAAMAACQKISDAKKEENECDLWASGNIVVASRPPVPPQPWLVRDPSINRPFVAADVPLVDAQAKKNLERYITFFKSKALALAPTAKTYSIANVNNRQELERRTLERCGYTYSVSCMIIAIDDEFVVPIPKLAKVVGFFRPEALTDVAPGVRESVAEQLEHAHSGWNAVATAASGQVGVELGASSEQSAIDRAMSACSKQDSGCRIAVLGPFMVEPAAPAAALNSPSTP